MKLALLVKGFAASLICLCLEAGVLVGMLKNTDLQALMQLIACKRRLEDSSAMVMFKSSTAAVGPNMCEQCEKR